MGGRFLIAAAVPVIVSGPHYHVLFVYSFVSHMVLEESIWLYWLAIVILALLLVAHVLLIPPPRPKFASKTAEWACYFRYGIIPVMAAPGRAPKCLFAALQCHSVMYPSFLTSK